MKVQGNSEPMAKKISWLEAAEIIGVCDRTMRRMRARCESSATTDYSINDTENGRQPSLQAHIAFWRSCFADKQQVPTQVARILLDNQPVAQLEAGFCSNWELMGV